MRPDFISRRRHSIFLSGFWSTALPSISFPLLQPIPIFTADKYIKTQFNIMVDPMKYPIYAVRFLKENGIKGNILLPFEWGEYAIWKLYPDCRVSIDGRFRTVYPEEVLNEHLGAFHDPVKLRQLLAKYPPDILLASQNPSSLEFKSTQRDWIYVYSDPISIVFIKDWVPREISWKSSKERN